MTHRFFLSPEAFTRGEDNRPTGVVFPGPVAHQLRNVLRLRPGARVVALDDSGWEYEVELVDLSGSGASGRVCQGRKASGEPRVCLVLYQGMLKGQRFEWILQKGTELGVGTFVPIETRRTVARPSRRWDRKRSRWERIAREAAEQSGRGRLPRLADPIPFAEACREAATCDLALIPWEGRGDVPRTTGSARTTDAAGAASPRREGQGLAGALRASDVSPQSVALLIGPEGGLEEEEIDLARRTGLRAVTLGPRILRAETAALAAATIVLSELGEMQ